MSDYAKLKALAEAATPGPWSYDGSYVCPARVEVGTTYVETWRSVADCHQPENTQFIAAANPAVVLELIAENERLREAHEQVCTNYNQVSYASEERGKQIDQLKAECEGLSSVVEDLERSRITGFEEYDFTRLKDRKGDQKVFEITIETECGCDIEEGEYTVRVTHLLGNWMGSDDFGLIGDAIAEVVADLGLPEEGHTTFIAYESGERQDVFWTKWYEIATVASVLREAAQ